MSLTHRDPQAPKALMPPEGVPLDHWKRIARPGDGVWLVNECDARGEVVGTATRGPDGSKGFQTGGKRGLILPDGRLPDEAGMREDDPLCITEGASDCAAMLSLGFDAVGVPMSGGSAGVRASLAELCTGRHAAIIRDADEAGERGARKIAEALLGHADSVRIAVPPLGKKDCRDAVLAYANRADFDEAIAHAEPFTSADSATPVYETPAGDPVEGFRRQLTQERIADFTPFPTDQLPEPIRSFVREGAASIGCDPALLALPALVMFGGAIGTTHALQVKKGWLAFPALWGVLVAKSGQHKTPALSAVFELLDDEEARVQEEGAAARAEYELEKAAYDAEMREWRNRKPENRVDMPKKPEPPAVTRYMGNDTTIEAIIPILKANPRGIVVHRDELSGWFGAFDRYAKGGRGGGDAGHWLSMFDGKPVTVDRKSAEAGPLYVPRALVSVVGGIQPGVLRRVATVENRESGMMARFLMCRPPERAALWTDDEIDDQVKGRVRDALRYLLGMQHPSVENGKLIPYRFVMDADAKRDFVDFYNRCAQERMKLAQDDAAAFSKISGYAPRLALIVRLIREAGGERDLRQGTVDAESMAKGIALAEWFGREARRVYAELDEGEADRQVRELVELIRRDGGDISGRELVHRSRMFNTVADAEAALTGLVEAGAGLWVTPQQHGRGRPKARRFVLSPVYGVNINRNTSGDTENANSVDVDGEYASPHTSDERGEL